jgi:hypothetical protein
MWTLDSLSTTITLMFLLLVVIFTWNFIVIRWNNAEHYSELYATAVFLGERIVNSPGVPESWENLPNGNESGIVSLGLVDERNVLNNAKLARLSNLSGNYTLMKQKLGVTRYNFYVNISSSNSTYYFFGVGNPGNESAELDRLALLNGSMVLVHIGVWG